MRKSDSRIQARRSISRELPPAPNQPHPTPPALSFRRDLPPDKDHAPIWEVIWKCMELNMALVAGAVSGLLLTVLVCGLFAMMGAGIDDAFLLGLVVCPFAMLGLALLFAFVVLFANRPRDENE
jgi:hypothetical protein